LPKYLYNLQIIRTFLHSTYYPPQEYPSLIERVYLLRNLLLVSPLVIAFTNLLRYEFICLEKFPRLRNPVRMIASPLGRSSVRPTALRASYGRRWRSQTLVRMIASPLGRRLATATLSPDAGAPCGILLQTSLRLQNFSLCLSVVNYFFCVPH
jgi:hypothetical protein